LKCINEKSD